MGFPFAAVGSAIGAGLNFLSARDTNKEQLKFARELNQNRVSWTVADAKRAGIHPLAALGASSIGGFASPSFVTPDVSGVGDAISGLEGRFDKKAMKGEGKSSLDKAGYMLDLELKKAMIEEARSRSVLNAAEAASRSATTRVVDQKPGQLHTPFGSMDIQPGANAQDMQNEYGEGMESVYGIAKFLWDLGAKNRAIMDRKRLESDRQRRSPERIVIPLR